MTSIFAKLFGGERPKEPASPVREDPVPYGSYSIISAPEKTKDGQWRLAGHIIKLVDGGELERTYIRVDTFMSREEAVDFTLRKGKQIIDQQGVLLFENGEPTGRA